MNFETFTNTAFSLWTGGVRTTLTVLGSPGIGKTSAARALAQKMYEHKKETNPSAAPPVCEVLDLSSKMPEDIGGIPFKSEAVIGERKGLVTDYAVQSWLLPLCVPGAYGVLVLDDLPAADKAVAIACRQLALERRVNQHKLAEDVMIIVTGNRHSDRAGARALPSHFVNSTIMLKMKPSFEGWEEWYLGQGFDPVIPAYLRYKTSDFSKLPSDADDSGVFPTPRTWGMLGAAIGSLPADESAVREAVSGLISAPTAANFLAFRRLRAEVISPEKVLLDPQKAVPDPEVFTSKPDQLIALVTAIAEATIQQQLHDRQKGAEYVSRFLVAICYLGGGPRKEFLATGIRHYRALRKASDVLADSRDFHTAYRNVSGHPIVQPVMASIREIFAGRK